MVDLIVSRSNVIMTTIHLDIAQVNTRLDFQFVPPIFSSQPPPSTSQVHGTRVFLPTCYRDGAKLCRRCCKLISPNGDLLLHTSRVAVIIIIINSAPFALLPLTCFSFYYYCTGTNNNMGHVGNKNVFIKL